MDAVSEIKARLSIEDVISEYVQLKRAGKNYKGLSPFTNEKTPSFVVSPEKQIWHDFSSGKGGDVFSFVMESEGLDFRGALELLARKAGIELEQFQNKKTKGPNKERLHELLDVAATFYQFQLSANQAALEYVRKKRQFDKSTIIEFKLGYSPDGGTALKDYLAKKGYSVAEMKSVGLVAERRGGQADMFRGRIMIPLMDSFGRVVGFTARLLQDSAQAPKYINTPSTVLYDKSRHIYGLHLAKKAIQREKFCVLVEGNLDVIASHQAGVSHVVATAGTALTEYQLKTLGRLTPDIRLAFDQDQAGLAATERAIPIASKVGVELSIITIPSGKDPDELIQQDPSLWKNILSKHSYALEWLISVYKTRLDLSTGAGKRQFSDITLRVVRTLQDTVEQDHYVQELASILEVHPDSLRAKLKKSEFGSAKVLKKTKPGTQKPDSTNPEAIRTGDHLLGMALMLPGTRGYLDMIEPEMLHNTHAKQLLVFLKTHPEFDGDLKEIQQHMTKDPVTKKDSPQEDDEQPLLQNYQDYVKIVSLQFEELYGTVDTLELQYEAARLRAKVIDYFVKEQKTKISSELEQATGKDATVLLERARELDQLLNRVKEKNG